MFPRYTFRSILLVFLVRLWLDLIFAPVLLIAAFIGRFCQRAVDVGLGPTPIINSPYHKKALLQEGYKAEFFVDTLWYYTSGYDYAPGLLLHGPLRAFCPYWLSIRSFFRYKTLYHSFDGGSLRSTAWLYLLEPFFLKVSGIKTVILPFGADVHDLTRAHDPYFVHAYGIDYPYHHLLQRRIALKVRLWSKWADYIVGGCDWVLYMPYWDSLTVGHFAIDTEALKLKSPKVISPSGVTLRLLHAPNHRALKGTSFIEAAVKDLQSEGLDLELRIVAKVPNEKILEEIEHADIVIDQVIIGWYAMFSIEAMSLSTPCICYLNPDLLRLYERCGLIEPGECPLISASPETFKEVLRDLYYDRTSLVAASQVGRSFVEKHHSLEAIGKLFSAIQCELFQ